MHNNYYCLKRCIVSTFDSLHRIEKHCTHWIYTEYYEELKNALDFNDWKLICQKISAKAF